MIVSFFFSARIFESKFDVHFFHLRFLYGSRWAGSLSTPVRPSSLGADPVHGLLGLEPSHPRVLLDARNEVHDRLAPPVRHEPRRRLGTGVLGRHQLDVAALPLLRLWFDDVLVDIVQIDGGELARLPLIVEPAGEEPILICEALQLLDLSCWSDILRD